MPLSFLNPALLLGLLGAAAPIAIHLLGRRKGRERRFAAIDFLLASEKRLAARRRIRNLLLLLTRVALVAAIALALARPLLRGDAAAAAAEPVAAVLVLDCSASMSATASGASAFIRARDLLERALARLPPGSEVAVATIDREPRRLAGWGGPGEARRALAAATPGFGRGSVGDGLAAALALLAGAHRPRHEVYLATDLQRSGFDLEALGRRGPDAARLVVLDAGDAGGANVGLVGAESQEGSGSLAVTAIRSGAAGAPDEALVRLLVSGQVANRTLARFGGGRSATVPLALPADLPRGAAIECDLAAGGSLAADDRRFVYLDRVGVVAVLVVDGAPHPDLYQDEVFYLERALDAVPGRFRKTVVDATAADLPDLAGFDVVVLANVAALPPRAAAALDRFAVAGGGILVALGDRAAGAAPRDGIDPGLGSLLPGRARSLVAWRPGEPPLTVAPPARPLHPVLVPFETGPSGDALAAARVTRLVAFESSPEATPILRLENGLPLLVEARRGKGRIALWTSSLDRGWSDFPLRPAYVPIVSRLVLYLGGALDRPRRHDYLAGDRVVLEAEDLVRAGERVVVEGPGGGRLEPLAVAPGRFELESAAALGWYRVQVGERREPRLDFVVNLDPREADLERIDPATLAAALGPEAAASAGGDVLAGVASEGALLAAALATVAFALEALLGLPPRPGRGASPAAVGTEA